MNPSATTVLKTASKEIGQWQWQSNPNPWDEKEMPQWESYSSKENELIEEAYDAKQKEVDLGDYLVYPVDLLQIKKGNPQAQRRIRRNDGMDDEEIHNRSARYFESELPKTINRIFGGLGDFISFFSRRNKEILEFTSHFKELEKSPDLDILNQKINPKLVECLEEVLLKPIEEKGKNSSLSFFQKKMLAKVKDLISPFHKGFSSFEEFYGQILKAYTMNTDLYPGLNQYLRDESWVKMDKLLPYAFCLCKAFFHLKLKPSLTKVEEEKFDPLKSEELTSTILYRGTAFDEFALSFYDKTKIQYFSWNAVTSTTTNKQMAEKFMDECAAADLEKKKHPVMFIIEVPDTIESEEYLKCLDIRKYSAIPKEDEVVLPPGSVFELLEAFTDLEKKTIIKMKLKNEVQSLAHGGLMMQGTLQSQMMTEKEAKIMCLDGEELSQALMSLHGNQLIEEVEFCLCIFDGKFLAKMLEILPTLERIKTLKFIACNSEDNEERKDGKIPDGEKCEITKLEVIGASKFLKVLFNEKWDQKYWVALRELDLDFQSQRSIRDEELNGEVSLRLKYFPQLVSLNVNFGKCYCITDAGLNNLTHSLNSLTQLESLNINLEYCHSITNDGVNSLAHSLHFLTRLVHLNISFFLCENVRDEGVDNLAKSLSSLTHLAHLNMNFQGCRQITDGVTNNLAKALNSLIHLTYLNINFRQCGQITDNGMNILASQGFKSLSQLKSLNFGFDSVENARPLSTGVGYLTQLASLTLDTLHFDDEGLHSFVSDGLKPLLQLKSLTLHFWRKKDKEQITHKGLRVFASQGLKPLHSLTSLCLEFTGFDQITDKGIESLASEGLKHLIQLRFLVLKFISCPEITEKGVSSLMSQGIKNMTQLTSLSLDFADCSQVTEKGMKTLAPEWLRNLPIFESLIAWDQTLETPDILAQEQLRNPQRVKLARKSSQKYKQYLDEQSEKIVSQDSLEKLIPVSKKNGDRTYDPKSTFKALEISPGIHHFTSLNLNFQKNKDTITDEFVHNFADQVIGNSPQLRFLTLNFDGCHQITDEGISNLALSGLKYLTALTSLNLTLNFNSYFPSQITDKGMFVLASKGLRHLSQLESLNLGFSKCNQITGKGVRDLALHGLKSLVNLTSCNLNFFSCSEIMDEGLLDLALEGLRHLNKLKSLNLHFIFCDKITAEGWMNLAWNGLRHLSQLESLVFEPCTEISDEGLKNLALHGLKPLFKLASLNLDFYSCRKITDQGMTDLACEGLRHLSQLKSLTLKFYICDKLTDKGWFNLAWNGLRHLSKLESLVLEPCPEITNQGVDSLMSQGFKYLTQLKSLSLNLSFSKITEKGANNLILQVVKNLHQLISLSLDLRNVDNITDFTIQNIIKVLHYFGFTKEIEEASDTRYPRAHCAKFYPETQLSLIPCIRHSHKDAI